MVVKKKQVAFDVLFEAGHTYSYTWEEISLYCPRCGCNPVWHEDGPGDYYAGEEYMCAECGSCWYLAGGVHDAGKDDKGSKVLAEIRAVVDRYEVSLE